MTLELRHLRLLSLKKKISKRPHWSLSNHCDSVKFVIKEKTKQREVNFYFIFLFCYLACELELLTSYFNKCRVKERVSLEKVLSELLRRFLSFL